MVRIFLEYLQLDLVVIYFNCIFAYEFMAKIIRFTDDGLISRNTYQVSKPKTI